MRRGAEVQLPHGGHQLLAVGPQGDERLHEPALPFRRELQEPHPAVVGGVPALDQPRLLGALDQLGDGGLLHLEAVREVVGRTAAPPPARIISRRS